jgi:hypothetical protein
MKAVNLAILSLVMSAQTALSAPVQWQLPVQLGTTRDSVHQTLGPPTETINRDSLRNQYPDLAEPIGDIDNEYFYSSGLVARFYGGRVFGLTINTHGDYRGWIDYKGKIVNGVALSDNYDAVLEKLGMPTKVEEDPIRESGDDLDNPVVFSAERRCYWRTDTYTVQIDFFLQAQSISETITAQRNSISVVYVYK